MREGVAQRHHVECRCARSAQTAVHGSLSRKRKRHERFNLDALAVREVQGEAGVFGNDRAIVAGVVGEGAVALDLGDGDAPLRGLAARRLGQHGGPAAAVAPGNAP